MDKAPDLIEPFVGWRVWRTSVGYQRLWLAAMYFDLRWPLGRPARATCHIASHRAPEQDDCKCGLHAAKTLEGALDYTPGCMKRTAPAWERETTNCVIGTVKMWGRVVEHEHGYRAEYAYPERLYVPANFQAAELLLAPQGIRLLRGYRVPVEIIGSARDLAA